MADNSQLEWLAQMMGLGAGAGSAAGGAWNLFGGGGKNPADVANSYIGQIPGKTEGYYNPYMNAGKGAMGDLQNQYKNLLGGGVQNQLGAGYKESPGYRFKLDQAMQAGNNAAGSGGMLGTPMHQQQNMTMANNLASQDYNDYIKNQMGLYGLGLTGEQGLNQMGFDANKGMADTWGNALSQQAGYGYAGQAGQNASKSQGLNSLFSGLGMMGGSLMGGDNAALLKMLGIGG